MSSWHTLAHVVADPLPADWRDQLAKRLGQRPRRIGPWAELALYGARLCLDAAQEPALAAGAQMRVASLSGPVSAARTITEQARTGLLMPFAFMQSQPSADELEYWFKAWYFNKLRGWLILYAFIAKARIW